MHPMLALRQEEWPDPNVSLDEGPAGDLRLRLAVWGLPGPEKGHDEAEKGAGSESLRFETVQRSRRSVAVTLFVMPIRALLA